MSSDKDDAYQREFANVCLLNDRLGKPVDPKIRDLVTILRLLGFTTTASCAGHTYRVTTGPYVMFKSRASDTIHQEAKRCAEQVKRDALLNTARDVTLREAFSLRDLLEEFYQSHTDSLSQVLEIRPVGYSGYRLCFRHADFSHVLSKSQHRTEIADRQRVLNQFCLHLSAELRA